MAGTILYIKPVAASFVLSDQKILEKHYRVVPFQIRQSEGKWRYFLSLMSLAFFLLKKAGQAHAMACWFGDYHTAIMVLVARLMRRPSMVFAGGQEAICYRKLGKGVYQKRFRSFFVRYALRNCTLILPNHSSLIYHENHFYSPEKPHVDGIKHYVGKIKGRYEVIPNGIDTNRINRNPETEKEPGLVVTIGTMLKTADFYNKGFDLFIESAKRCSDLKFVLIGLKKEFFDWTESVYKISGIRNLTIISAYCPTEVLSEYLNKASVYVQVSITEGMPVSLGEAMICECIPVGSNVNGIPDAIGETGIIIKKRDPGELVSAIRTAIKMNTGKLAREHTLKHYSTEVREKRIVEVFSQFLDGQQPAGLLIGGFSQKT